jgi:hypothetical protein
VLWYRSTALERRAKETSRLNKTYAEYVEELQRNKWEIIEQLRQSRSRVFRLQAELQSERATRAREDRQFSGVNGEGVGAARRRIEAIGANSESVGGLRRR